MPDIKTKSRPNVNKTFGNNANNKNTFNASVGNNSTTNSTINGKNGCNSNNKKSREIEAAPTGLTGYNNSLQQSADNPEILSNQQQQSHNGKPVLHVFK